MTTPVWYMVGTRNVQRLKSGSFKWEFIISHINNISLSIMFSSRMVQTDMQLRVRREGEGEGGRKDEGGREEE